MTFYCTADGTGPLPPRSWIGATDEEQEALNAERIATASHFVRNANGPRTFTESPESVALYLANGASVDVGSPDEHGGGVASLVRADGSLIGALLCPECGAQARAVAPETDAL